METNKNMYNKTDMMKIFGMKHQKQFDRIRNRIKETYNEELPVGENLMDSRKVYTDETIEFLEKKGFKRKDVENNDSTEEIK